MWFDRHRGLPDWSQAVAHLSAVDPVMKEIIARVGPCTLVPRRDCYIALCQSIFAQQVSTAVATVLFKRFRALFPGRRPTPERALALSDESLRSAGLSRQKLSYIRDLSQRFAGGEIPVRRFGRMSDEEIIEALLPIRGVGRWTAEMFLIFVLNRPDLLPVDDFGVKKNAQAIYRMRKMPSEKRLMTLGEPWRPWRTIGTWYLWRWGGLPAAQ